MKNYDQKTSSEYYIIVVMRRRDPSTIHFMFVDGQRSLGQRSIELYDDDDASAARVELYRVSIKAREKMEVGSNGEEGGQSKGEIFF